MGEVVFVGTSDAFGAGGRRQAAIVVRAPGGSALLDCGATTGTGLADLGIERDEIESVVITHFHGDHFAGIAQLLVGCVYEDQRKHPLTIAGPPEIERRVRALGVALGHPIEDLPAEFELRFRVVPTEREIEVGPIRVQSFETRHQPESCPHGLVVAAGRERIVYSGDTGWFDELPERSRGADLFICECTFARRQFEYHMNYDQLKSRRDEFDCRRMILTHLGRDMAARRGRCDIETADDGLAIRL